MAPQSPTIEAMGRRASRTPDLVVTNVEGRTMNVTREGIWSEASDHSPILLEVEEDGRETEVEIPRRISKTALNRPERRKEASNTYAATFPALIAKL